MTTEKEKSGNAATAINALIDVMAKLRDPETGCQWDVAQDFSTISPYTIEEAYEVADAIDRNDLDDLKHELGDLLLQVVFHARMAEEDGHFAFADVAESITDKMIRRHPHVFGTEDQRDPDAQTKAWEEQKAEERAALAEKNGGKPVGILDGVALALPALMRAEKLQKRAARHGFDWPEIGPVYGKIEEELEETRDAIGSGAGIEKIEEEIGDLLFACVNLARHKKIDPEIALRRANAKFERRFGQVETYLAIDGKSPDDATLEEMDRLWNRAKRETPANDE